MSAVDIFANRALGGGDSANDGFPITPDDDNDLPFVTRVIYVGTAGDLAVVMAGGSTATWPLAAGMPHPLRVSRVLATGTTADGIVGGY